MWVHPIPKSWREYSIELRHVSHYWTWIFISNLDVMCNFGHAFSFHDFYLFDKFHIHLGATMAKIAMVWNCKRFLMQETKDGLERICKNCLLNHATHIGDKMGHIVIEFELSLQLWKMLTPLEPKSLSNLLILQAPLCNLGMHH